MAVITIERTVDLDRLGRPEQAQGTLYVQEDQAHKFVISAKSKGETTALTGTVSASFVRPDQQTVALVGEIEDGCAAVTLSIACYAVTGRFSLTVFVTAGGATLAVYSLTGNVKATGTGAVVNPETLIPTIIGEANLETRGAAAIYVGDYLCEENYLPSCCVKIGDYFYAVDAPATEYAMQELTNDGHVRKFDIDNNVEVTAFKYTTPVGHANSMAYDSVGGVVYVAGDADYTQSPPVGSKALYKFDSSLAYVGVESDLPSTPQGVSFDPVTGKLYYIDANFDIYLKNRTSGTWTQYSKLVLPYANARLNKRYNQDFAVYNGMWYKSATGGDIIYGRIEPGTCVNVGVYSFSKMDSWERYYLGELEGMEFTEDGRLYAVWYTDLAEGIKDAFIVELPVGTSMSESSGLISANSVHNGTVELRADTQTAFALYEWEIRSLAQMEARVLRYNTSQVLIPEDNAVVEIAPIRVNDRIKLTINGTYTVPKIEVYSGVLNLSTANSDTTTPRLIIPGAEVPIHLLRAGDLIISGDYALRVSKPDNTTSTILIHVGTDFNKTTVRLVPISHEGVNYTIGTERKLVPYSTYMGTALVFGDSDIELHPTYTNNSYFGSAMVTSNSCYKVSESLYICQFHITPNSAAIPASGNVYIGELPFTPKHAVQVNAVNRLGEIITLTLFADKKIHVATESGVAKGSAAKTYFYINVAVQADF